MKSFILAPLLGLVAAVPTNEKRQLEQLTALLGGGAATPGAQNNNAAADPLTSIVGGGANPLAGIIKKRQLDEITKLIGGMTGGANPLSALTGGAATPAAAPAADPAAAAAQPPAQGQQAAGGDLLAGFAKQGLPIPRRRSRRQLEQITALLGKGKGKGNAKAAKGTDPLAALTGALGGAKAAKGNAQGNAKAKDPLAALGAIARKRALVKRRVAVTARDFEDEDDIMKKTKRQTFVPGQAQPQQGQAQPNTATGPTSDVGTILGVLSLGGPSGALTQNSGVGPILANDPSIAGLNNNGGLQPQQGGLQPQAGLQPQGLQPQGLQPQGIQPQGLQPQGLQPQGLQPQGLQPQGIQPQGLQPQGGQNGQQGGAGVTLSLTDPNVNQLGQPALISNGPVDIGGLQGSGIIL